MEYNKKKATGLCLLKYVQTVFFGIFILLFYVAINRWLGVWGNLLFGLSGLLTIVCIMADFGMKQGTRAKQLVKLHGATPCRNFGFTMGAVAMLPSYILTVLLIISKAGIMSYNFLPAYKLANPCFYPLIQLTAKSADISAMSWGGVIMPLVFPVLYMLSTGIGYRLTYDEIDIKEKVVYKH